MDTEYITTEEAGSELGVTARRVVALIKTGRLKAKAFGIPPRTTYRIKREDLEAVRNRPTGRPKKADPPEPSESKPKAKAKAKKKSK